MEWLLVATAVWIPMYLVYLLFSCLDRKTNDNGPLVIWLFIFAIFGAVEGSSWIKDKYRAEQESKT